jgi:hypothetical protein
VKGYFESVEEVSKDTGNDMEPIGLILLLPKPYKGFYASFNCSLSKHICLMVERNSISA